MKDFFLHFPCSGVFKGGYIYFKDVLSIIRNLSLWCHCYTNEWWMGSVDGCKKRKRPFSRGVMSSLQKWMGVVWVQEKEMKLRNPDIWKLYPFASGNDYTSSMGGTKESSSLDTCKRQNFVCHEYFVPKWHLPGKKTHLWSFPEINNNKRTHSWDPEKMHLWSCPKKKQLRSCLLQPNTNLSPTDPQ